MQLTSSRERSFMVSCLDGVVSGDMGPGSAGAFLGRHATEAGGGDDSGRPAVLQSEIARKNWRTKPENT
jgi:hypothetical protein